MEPLPEYDVAIAGGGLAGLAAAIGLQKKGHRVVLLEKESYPFHKVCGEYISRESWNFLQSLGLPLTAWHLPLIDTLQLTAPNGKLFQTSLPLGGFGLSRYKLDSALAALAKAAGVHLLERAKVDSIAQRDGFIISSGGHQIKASVCLAAYGKRSNLDVKWKRSFLQDQRLNNFVGVKYHVKMSWPENLVGLHNFENGYCGISRIEEDRCCLCYMTKAENLKRSGNSIARMEEQVLFRNPHLKKIFASAVVEPGFPVTISQISFAPKTKLEDGVLMLGDTAGMITPLCGNGMSIALHTARMVTVLVDAFLTNTLSRKQMENSYAQQWQQAFASRLRTGRVLQWFFGHEMVSNLFVAAFRRAPFLARPVIKLTHGEPF